MPLSNVTQQILTTAPYFDDYYQANTSANTTLGVDADFHRVLFRPRYGVQARELTQLQTLLQVQLERLGSASFRNGDRVIGGNLTLDVGATSGQVLPDATLSQFFNRDTNQGKYVFSTKNNDRKARITQYSAIDDGETSNNYLLFTYASSDEFVASDTIQDRDDSGINATFTTGSAFNAASLISIDEGVCFVSGFFVRIRPQTIVLDALSNTPSYRVGLVVEEQVVDELDDVVGESLGDPANQGAPGAHRLRVRLTLGKRSLLTDADDNFIELARVVNGIITTNQPSSGFVSMRELRDILAKRTNDESGDYIIRPFAPVLEGIASANNTNSAEIETFQLSLGEGKAYVRGYDIETTVPTRLPIDKAREVVMVDSATLAATVGNYMLVSRVGANSPGSYFGNTGTVDIHCVHVNELDTTSNTTYAYSRIGTTRVRTLEVEDVPDTITSYANTAEYFNASTYKLFFFDTRFDSLTGNVSSAITNRSTGVTTLYIPAPANGCPLVNNALDGVSISLDGTASGIYTINQYTANATHGAALELKEYLTSTPDDGTGYRLLFQARDVDAFAKFDADADMSAPYSVNLSFQADVAGAGKDSGLPTGYSKIFNPNDSSLVYQIPELYLVPGSLAPDSVQFTAWLASDTTLTGTSASNTVDVTMTWSTLASKLNFPIDTDASAQQASESFLLFDVSNDDAGRGRLIHFSDTSNASSRCATNISVDDTSLTFTYHHGEAISGARTLLAIGKGELTGVAPRLKSYQQGNTTHAKASTGEALSAGQVEFYALNTAPGAVYSLKTADVLRLSKVLYKSSNTAFADADMTGATDVTSYFTLDNGQRDNTYDYSTAIVQRGFSSVASPTGRLLFVFDWFNHTGAGYVHLDSYLHPANILRGFTYEDVPSFTSPRSHREISLRNVIDFRPVQSNKEFLGVSLVMAASNTSANTTYLTNDTEIPYLIPASDETWRGSYGYYLSRRDRVMLYPDGSFVVKQGQPSLRPELPPADADAMLLFDLTIPAYTLVDDDGAPTQVKIKSYDYKRYTMKDLSRMEDRVTHLEYYTALSQLEKSARDQSILDQDNQERFKNGIVVDAFTGTGVADVKRPDFAASVDTHGRMLRPAFRYAGDNPSLIERTNPQMTFMPDLQDGTTANVVVRGDMATLAYQESAFITQPLATRHVSVNPFNIVNYNGLIALEPAVDTGKSLAPAQVLDMGGPTEAWVAANLPSYTNWGEWTDTWTGVVSSTPRQTWWTPEGWTEDAHAFRSALSMTFEDVTTMTEMERQGTQFNFESVSTTRSIGNVIVDSYVIHNMRKRDVVFAASNMKPNTTVYPFFDGKDVSAYVQRANTLRLADMPRSMQPSFRRGDTIYVQKPLSGSISVAAGSTTLSGTGTVFTKELGAAHLVRIVKGSDTYVRFIESVNADNAATLRDAAPTTVSVSGGRVYSMTPVTIADIAERTYLNTNGIEYVQLTVDVVRVEHLGQPDDVIPYAIQAGSLSPDGLVFGSPATTNTASVIAPDRMWSRTSTSAFADYLVFSEDAGTQTFGEIPITTATIRSGVVREFNSATNTVRLDLDAPSNTEVDLSIGTPIYFVNGRAAGQQTVVAAYSPLTQTVTLDSTIRLRDIVPGQTIYSFGTLQTAGYLPMGAPTATGYDATTLNTPTATSVAGSVSGALHIQENQFPTGARVLRLLDSETNTLPSATTRAEGVYTASGLITVESSTSVVTREVVRTSQGVSDTDTRSNLTSTLLNAEWVDPLAQSFFVDPALYPAGIFVTSIDVVFASKPPAGDETPIRLELRPTVNGYPSSNEVVAAIAGEGRAVATLRPHQVRAVKTPSLASETAYTRFQFPAPVHLRAGEYAMVLISNSDEYRVYTAAMSEPVLGTNTIVGAQPYAGSFFKSQNASTWTAEQNEDLMFRINRATWNPGQNGTLVCRAVPFTTNAAFDTLTVFAYDGSFEGRTSVSYAARVLPMNPQTGDLTGSLASSYPITPTQPLYLPKRGMMLGNARVNTPDFMSLRPANDQYTPGTTANTVDLTVALRTTSSDVAPFVDIRKLHGVGVQHLLNDMSLVESQFEILTKGLGYPLNSVAAGTVSFGASDLTVTGSGTSFTSTLIPGRDVVIGGNLVVTVARVVNDVTCILSAATGVSRSANTYATYANAVITISGSDAGASATAIGVVKGLSSSNTSGILDRIVLTSPGSGYLTSPTISANGANTTNATIVYRGEDWLTGGNASTRYIIKPVTLADGFEARDLRVYFDAVRPAGANFYVYYRILGANDDASTLDRQSWRLMYQDTPNAAISTYPGQFREFTFSTLNNNASDASDASERFRSFAVKIVMASENTAGRIIPAVRNFRAIALDT